MMAPIHAYSSKLRTAASPIRRTFLIELKGHLWVGNLELASIRIDMASGALYRGETVPFGSMLQVTPDKLQNFLNP